jgi:hypothetical protein
LDEDQGVERTILHFYSGRISNAIGPKVIFDLIFFVPSAIPGIELKFILDWKNALKKKKFTRHCSRNANKWYD